MEAYTGHDGEAREWVDVILVAPIDAKLEAHALWGINAEGEARCTDLSWHRMARGMGMIVFNYGKPELGGYGMPTSGVTR